MNQESNFSAGWVLLARGISSHSRGLPTTPWFYDDPQPPRRQWGGSTPPFSPTAWTCPSRSIHYSVSRRCTSSRRVGLVRPGFRYAREHVGCGLDLSGTDPVFCQSNFLEGNLEVIEIPSHMIQSTPKKCNNLEEKGAPGLYHISFDVTASCLTLSTLLQELDAQSRLKFNKTLRILEPPAQRMLGSLTCEICFLSDPNNIPVELIRRISQLAHPMEPDW
mmetsp:Transcript_14480/g.29603  ORF Transcript_14480/g.29603 Transcript_14480/m.29603 type:complete len:220 (+) Transcript_14480:554-1213(+)